MIRKKIQFYHIVTYRKDTKMKLITLFSFFVISAATSAVSESINVAKLSDYEKKMHRWGWCASAVMAVPFGSLDQKDIMGISNIMSDRNYNSRALDPNQVYKKARTDVEAQVLIGELKIVQDDFDKCNQDLIAILKDEYVPYFSYMKN